MGVNYKLFGPGERDGNPFFLVRGTVNGRRLEVSTRTTDRAVAEARAVEILADALKAIPDEDRERTFAEAADAYVQYKRPKSKSDWQAIDALKAYFKGRTVKKITGADLISAANALLPAGSNGHKNRMVVTPASAILHYAAEQDWCPYKRHRRFHEPKVSSRRPAQPDTVRALIAATEGVQRLFLCWVYETGQRLGDALRVTSDDLDLVSGHARIGSSKTEDVGQIDLSPALVAMLATTPRQADGRVFPWRDRFGVYGWLRPLCRRLGVKYTPHQSRHALATDLRAGGMDMFSVAQRGLWRDERSASRYAHHRATGTAGRTVDKMVEAK